MHDKDSGISTVVSVKNLQVFQILLCYFTLGNLNGV